MGRAVGFDVRRGGSGNIGATNVARTLGARLGLVTLCVDVAKGALPVAVAAVLGVSPAGLALLGLAAFFGHIFSLFASFRGGKGVATAAGVFLVLAPVALAVACAVFALVVTRWRVVSVASLAAGFALPLAVLFSAGLGPFLWAAILVALTLVATHRDNLRRLASGTEPVVRSRRT